MQKLKKKKNYWQEAELVYKKIGIALIIDQSREKLILQILL